MIYGQITGMAKSIMAILEITHKNMKLYPKDYVSGCATFSFDCQFVSLMQAYLHLRLAETGSKCPLVFSVTRVLYPNMTGFKSQNNIAGMAKTMCAIFDFTPV